MSNEIIPYPRLTQSDKEGIPDFRVPEGIDERALEMLGCNCKNVRIIYSGGRGGKMTALEELKELLSLPVIPNYIEAYDISNTSGSENVAGMVTFMNGLPYKSGYKKFKIKSFVGQDDTRSMAEVLDRRFTEYDNSTKDSVGFGKLPDLILLDGGTYRRQDRDLYP